MLYVGGDQSGPWFKQMRARLLQLLPYADDVTVTAAGHLVASTDPFQLSELLLQHFRRYPKDSAGSPAHEGAELTHHQRAPAGAGSIPGAGVICDSSAPTQDGSRLASSQTSTWPLRGAKTQAASRVGCPQIVSSPWSSQPRSSLRPLP